MSGTLYLKWGTVKGWENLDDDAFAALQRFADEGLSASTMFQRMTPAHIDALCDLIDAVDEPIINEWSGGEMTREQTKAYVRSYPRD